MPSSLINSEIVMKSTSIFILKKTSKNIRVFAVPAVIRLSCVSRCLHLNRILIEQHDMIMI